MVQLVPLVEPLVPIVLLVGPVALFVYTHARRLSMGLVIIYPRGGLEKNKGGGLEFFKVYQGGGLCISYHCLRGGGGGGASKI